MTKFKELRIYMVAMAIACAVATFYYANFKIEYDHDWGHSIGDQNLNAIFPFILFAMWAIFLVLWVKCMKAKKEEENQGGQKNN